MKRLEDGDIVALLGEVARAGQAARAGADNRDLMAVRDGLGGGLLHVGVVPVGNKAFEAANADRLTLDAADALALALRLLRADAAADGGQRGGLVDDLIGALVVLLGDLLDELGDLHLHGAARDTGMILAVEAAGGFVERLLLGVAEGDLQEVFVADVGVLRGHLVLFQTHIRHLTGPPS